jgi:tungstate transport system substrate-binding protein
LSPAATRAAPTRWNTAYGVWRGSIPPKLMADRGTATSAAVWVRHCAQAMNAYTISDRGTWLSFGNKGDLTVLVEGDPRLLNRYDLILLNPAKHPVAKQALARRFAQWLLSPEGQEAIGAYKVDGEQLFHPSAAAPE